MEVWYTDGNMAEDKRVRAGWSNGLADRQEVEGNEALGRIATVWDGEVCGMRGALEAAGSGLEQRLLILSDSGPLSPQSRPQEEGEARDQGAS